MIIVPSPPKVAANITPFVPIAGEPTTLPFVLTLNKIPNVEVMIAGVSAAESWMYPAP